MTPAEFAAEVENRGIGREAYDLDGQRNESYVLAREGDAYLVFYSERGLAAEAERFLSESVALEQLLELLTQDPSTRAA